MTSSKYVLIPSVASIPTRSLLLLLVPGLSAVARDPLSLAYPLLFLADLLLLHIRNNPGTRTSIVTGVSSVVTALHPSLLLALVSVVVW
jgi:hypothetical protein